MKTATTWLLTASGVTAVLLFFACSKNSSSNSNPNIPKGQSQVSLYMMDGPIDFDSVLIDIRQVVVEVDTGTTQNAADQPNQWDAGYCGFGRSASNKSVIWDTLSITPGVYNLLSLRNGTDTLLASGLYPTGKIIKIQITLGSDNSVYTDSTTSYPLEIFGPNPYFTINVSRTNVDNVTNNQFKLWLDFNLSRSIFFWNGEFLLQPYFTVFNDMMTAKVQGQVLPHGADALVMGINGTDTIYAIPFWSGQYQFRNVPTGNWSFTFKGTTGYADTTISGIAVDSMKTVNLPTITLHK
jgi:uncharacterized protein DUF4382